LYAKARRGELKHFTGIDSAYERPEHPEITLDTSDASAEQSAERVLGHLVSAGIFDAYDSSLAAL
ncbi:adenylyl-sulfate kinase, partial [bacterium]